MGKGIGVVQSAQPSVSGQMVALKLSSFNKPRIIDVINTNGWGKVTELLDAEDPWKDYQQPIYTSGYITAADGITDLYYRMVNLEGLSAADLHQRLHHSSRWHHGLILQDGEATRL